jgi:hypothetical protein
MATKKKTVKPTTNDQASGSETPSGNEKRVQYTRELTCPLSREEVEERAQQAAALVERMDQRTAELKEQAARAKNEIHQLDLEHRALSSEVRSKTAVRPVACERIFDYDSGRVVETRLDTGEVLTSRQMVDSERQRDLDLDDDFHE